MGPNGPPSELVFLDDTVYKDWISFQFTFRHKDILVTTQDCIGICEWYLWIGLID